MGKERHVRGPIYCFLDSCRNEQEASDIIANFVIAVSAILTVLLFVALLIAAFWDA